MESHIENIALLLFIAGLVAMPGRRYHFPYTIGLLFAGISLAFVSFVHSFTLTKELIFTCLLPPLIFEAALFLPWKELRRVLPVVLLASAGLILSALVTTLGMHYLLGCSLAAGIFGVLIAATDPVSVIATFKEAGVEGKLRILVEDECLFDGGTARGHTGAISEKGRGAVVAFSVVVQGLTITPLMAALGLLAKDKHGQHDPAE